MASGGRGQIQNPKPEIRRKSEIRSPNPEIADEASGPPFRISVFGLPSEFGIRVSDLRLQDRDCFSLADCRRRVKLGA